MSEYLNESFSDLPDETTEGRDDTESVDTVVEAPSEALENALEIEDLESDVEEDSGQGYPFDRDEWWQRGMHAIDQNIDAIRDDYLDKGYVEGEELDGVLAQERSRLEAEFLNDFDGQGADDLLKEENPSFDLATALDGEEIQDEIEEYEAVPMPSDGIDDNVASDEWLEKPDEEAEATELLQMEEESEYDLDGIDIMGNADEMNEVLAPFEKEAWEEASMDARKENLLELADYVQRQLALATPPSIEYYNHADPGDYGGYSHDDNTLLINEYTLGDGEEAVDTIAHELWHAYQWQRADEPRPGVAGAADWQRQYGLSPEHYVQPQYGDDGICINFDEYQSQMVEEEARAFASQVRGHLHGKREE